MSDWLELKNGNYWKHVAGNDGVTVFCTEYSDHGASFVWKWVYDGEYHGEWAEPDGAMENADAMLDLE